ncbi:hypothetical protein NEF87_004613 [Candidatus Lokiarchaeum ossiferum]|uniref:HEAT repeat domain-containing protein n=1 Tax=Candidatus Lokiarchaeum ossiferum TaxID=2951803 RepID=A0ABY6HXS4_9ARCH|nr:hypothetical protein NEF87_004613 [Candidatus Lokiarchaeum sp. B-35]
MVSISSKSKIKERTLVFWRKFTIWNNMEINTHKYELINQFLQDEYSIIPEKERVGKGKYYITVSMAEGLITQKNLGTFFPNIEKNIPKILNFIQQLLKIAEEKQNTFVIFLGLCFLGQLIKFETTSMKRVYNIVKKWANHSTWEIREVSCYPIRIGLKYRKNDTLRTLLELTHSSEHNLRRLAVESLRASADLKWLRDPSENQDMITILKNLNHDENIYVRKATGNNLKDLSKYIPEKILELANEWIKEANILISDDLASKTKKELGKDNFNLIWTLKHALRWIQARNPEYHPQLTLVMGSNYVQYFHEKTNKRALPKKK